MWVGVFSVLNFYTTLVRHVAIVAHVVPCGGSEQTPRSLKWCCSVVRNITIITEAVHFAPPLFGKYCADENMNAKQKSFFWCNVNGPSVRLIFQTRAVAAVEYISDMGPFEDVLNSSIQDHQEQFWIDDERFVSSLPNGFN